MIIRISLPEDRDYAGRLEVLDAAGAVVLGPFPAAGRAHDKPAAAHGNALRNPLLPYGDTPIGTYSVRGAVESGLGTALDSKVFGVHGVVLLEPVSGQAALADAHGRFRLFIQGGDDDEGGLRATAGAVRLLDRDQKQLVALLGRIAERVLCEIIPTAECGAKVGVTRPPFDSDPPELPGQSYVATQPTRSRSATNLGPRTLMSSAGSRPARSRTRFFVVPEHSGSGGTSYGTDGGGDTTGADDGSNQPVVTATDSVPSPGADLNAPPDQTVVIENASGASQLLSTAAQTGLSSPYGPEQGGWLVAPQEGNSYTNVTGPGGPLIAYAGNDVETYSGTPSNAGNANSYTGTPNVYPYYPDSQNAAPSQASPLNPSQAPTSSGYIQPDKINPQLAPDQMAALVAQYAQYDAQLAASQLDQTAGQGGFAPGSSQRGNSFGSASSTGPPTPSGPVQNQPVNTSPLAPPAGPGSALPPPIGTYFLANAVAQLLPSGYKFTASPTTQTFEIPALELPSFDMAVRASGNPAAASGSPVATHILLDPNPLEQGFTATNPSRTATPADHALGNLRGEYFETYEGQQYRYIKGNSPYISMSTNLELAAFGEFPFEGEKFLINLEALGPGTSIIRNAEIIASVREYAAANPTEASRAQTYINYQPIEQEAFTHPTIPSEAVSLLSDARITLQAETAIPPSAASIFRNNLANAGLFGGATGAGISTLLQVGQMAFSDKQYSGADYGTATARTLFAGGASGATGAAIETTFNAQVGQQISQSLLGGVARGALGGGLAGAVFQTAQMALSDQQYSAMDYAAKDTRVAVEGVLSGALAAGVVGAIWGSEVPLLGNAVGFAVGFLAYVAADYLFGDQIEKEVRSLDAPTNDPSGFLGPQNADDPSGFLDFPGF
jgi:hypothetical protein